MPYSHHQQRLTSFYRYKYGYSFYLFLLSFSLSELAALFDMAAYFRKFPPNHYVITFHRQEPSPFMATSTTSPPMTMTLPMTMTNSNHHSHHHSYNNTLNHNHHHSHSVGRNNFHTLPANHNHHHQPGLINNGPMGQKKFQPIPPPGTQHPDICSTDYSSEHIDLTMASRHSMEHGLPYGVMQTGNGNVDQCDPPIMPPQAYMSSEVTITTIERSSGYGTIRNNAKMPSTATMESFGTLRKENNV